MFSFLRRKKKENQQKIATRFSTSKRVSVNLTDGEICQAIADFAKKKYFPNSEIELPDVYIYPRDFTPPEKQTVKWCNNHFEGVSIHVKATIVAPIF